jgi:hypothetical protein
MRLEFITLKKRLLGMHQCEDDATTGMHSCNGTSLIIHRSRNVALNDLNHDLLILASSFRTGQTHLCTTISRSMRSIQRI